MPVDILALRRRQDRRLGMLGFGVFLVLAMANTALVASIGLGLTARLLIGGVGLGLVTRAFRLESVSRPSTGVGPGPRYGAFALATFAGVASMFAVAAVVDAVTRRPVPAAYGAAIHQALARCADFFEAAPRGCPQSWRGGVYGPVEWALFGDPLDGAIYRDALFGPGWVEGVAIYSAADPLPFPLRQAVPTAYAAYDVGSAGGPRLRPSVLSDDVVKRRPILSDARLEEAVTSRIRMSSSEPDLALRAVWSRFDARTGIVTVGGTYGHGIDDSTYRGRQFCWVRFADQVVVHAGEPLTIGTEARRHCREASRLTGR